MSNLINWNGINLTELEIKVLKEYLPEQDCFDSGSGVFDFNEVSQMTNIPLTQLKGVIGSLVKKQILDVDITNNCYSQQNFNLICIGRLLNCNEENFDSLMKLI